MIAPHILAAPIAALPSPDAPLIAVCEAALTITAEIRDLGRAAAVAAPALHSRLVAQLREAVQLQGELHQQIADMTAHTAAGLAAKARVVVARWESVPPASAEIAVSLCHDLLDGEG